MRLRRDAEAVGVGFEGQQQEPDPAVGYPCEGQRLVDYDLRLIRPASGRVERGD